MIITPKNYLCVPLASSVPLFPIPIVFPCPRSHSLPASDLTVCLLPLPPNPPPDVHILRANLSKSNKQSLAAVNFFLGCVGVIQVSRIALHNPKSAIEAVKEEAKEVKEEVKDKVEKA